MKRVIYRVMTFLCMISLLAGLFIAYAEMDAEKESGEKGATPIDYGFYLSMNSNGATDLATPREKESTDSYAYYLLSTITNPTSYKIYVNVNNQTGTNDVGTEHKIYSGTSTPYSFNVYYKSGYGNVGTYYRPSGHTSPQAFVGAYVQGLWHP